MKCQRLLNCSTGHLEDAIPAANLLVKRFKYKRKVVSYVFKFIPAFGATCA